MELQVPADFGRLPQDLEIAIFRIVQECVTNIHRHSGSSVAQVCISHSDGQVCIEVQDRGKGISSAKQSDIQLGRAGVGIRGIRERVRQLKGSLQINSPGNGMGTTVVVHLPVAKISAAVITENVL